MKQTLSFWHGFGVHDCVSQNKPNQPASHWHVKSVLSKVGMHLPLPQSTSTHIAAISQNAPENPIGHAQLMLVPLIIEHIALFWQIGGVAGHETLVLGGGFMFKFKSQKAPLNDYKHSNSWFKLNKFEIKPENPVAQRQLIVKSKSKHMPPFWQGLFIVGGHRPGIGGTTAVDVSQNAPNFIKI